MTDRTTQEISDAEQALEGLMPPVVRRESDRSEAPRTRRQANLGGARLKLAVHGTIPGHAMYWCNDDNNEIAQLLEEGFSFVKAGEVGLNRGVVQDNDVDGRVSKYVGTKQNGDPMRAYLLKCPQEIWDDIQAASQDQANEWDSAILAGVVGNVDSSYSPKGHETRLNRVAQRR